MNLARTLLYAGLTATGFGTGYLSQDRPAFDYTIIERHNAPYLLDKKNNIELPIIRVNRKPHLGDRVYRLEGILEEEKDSEASSEALKKFMVDKNEER